MIQQARSSRRRTPVRAWLVAALAISVAAYAVLVPQLNRVRRNTQMLRQRDAAIRARIARLTQAKAGVEEAQRRANNQPDSPAAHVQLAVKLEDAGHMRAAISACNAALAQDSGNLPALQVLGDIYTRARRYDQAIAVYRTILGFAPYQAEASAALGWIYISLGWTLTARDLLGPALTHNPHDPHLAAALALACVQHDDFKRAAVLLTQVRQEFPREISLWSPLVDVYLKMHRPSDAVAVARDAVKLGPGDARLQFGLGLALYESGTKQLARGAFEAALAIDPTSTEATYRLAMCAIADHNAVQERKLLESVASRDPDYQQVRLLLGQLDLREGRAREGRQLIAEYHSRREAWQQHDKLSLLVSMKPRDPIAHYDMGRLYLHEGDYPHAVAELRLATTLNPALPNGVSTLRKAVALRDSAPIP